MNNKLKKNGIILIIVLLSVSLFTLIFFAGKTNTANGEINEDNLYKGKPVKYVFVFIGDGMALPQINSAELFLSYMTSDMAKIKKLSFTQFPAQGLTTTYASDSFITDSAAAATAIATGYKTNSGVISMDTTKTKNYETIAELAKKMGMKIGIISSVSIDHATPACFYSHVDNRGNYYEISRQMIETGFDFYAGGGMKGNSPSKRKNNPDLIELAKQKGYDILSDRNSFLNYVFNGKKVIAYDEFLDRDYALDYDIVKNKNSVSLAEYTQKAIQILDNPGGFFIMVEGGKIDWACHANDAATSIVDTLAFDDAVRIAIEFYREHPDETAIIVTGDHETGGMTIGFSGTGYSTFFEKIHQQDISYDFFDKIIDNYRNKSGKKDFMEFFPEIEKHFGLNILTDTEKTDLEKKVRAGDKAARLKLGLTLSNYELQQLKDSFVMSMNKEKIVATDELTYLLYGGYEPLSVSITHLLNQKSGIGWTSYSHTGVPVPTFALGIGALSFNGYYDNTDIFYKLAAILGIKK